MAINIMDRSFIELANNSIIDVGEKNVSFYYIPIGKQEENTYNFNVGKNAEISILTTNSYDLAQVTNLHVELKENAIVNIYNVVITSKNQKVVQDIYLLAPNTQVNILNVYLGSDDAIIKSVVKVNHQSSDSISFLDNYAIALDNSYIIMDNNATIAMGAKRSDVKQRAKGLTLSKTSKIKAMPNLYIDEYDVIAGHAATIGSISPDDLYYLMSRGLTKEEASKLVIIGFIKPVIDNIDNQSLKDQIEKKFISKLNS